MINSVVLLGRLTKDIDLRKTQSNVSTTTFTLACDRRYKTENGPSADFIQCVAWRQSADFLGQYAHKGDIVGVEGSIQTRTYDGQNGKVYVTEVQCDNVRLINNNKATSQETQKEAPAAAFETVSKPGVSISSDDLPFDSEDPWDTGEQVEMKFY